MKHLSFTIAVLIGLMLCGCGEKKSPLDAEARDSGMRAAAALVAVDHTGMRCYDTDIDAAKLIDEIETDIYAVRHDDNGYVYARLPAPGWPGVELAPEPSVWQDCRLEFCTHPETFWATEELGDGTLAITGIAPGAGPLEGEVILPGEIGGQTVTAVLEEKDYTTAVPWS